MADVAQFPKEAAESSALTDSSGPSVPGGERLERLGFLAILVLYAAYATWFILRSAFEVGGELYFCLFDDAMISMRYARNLALGHGLVWNPGGDRVEGFTNLFWVLYMGLWHLLPLPASKMSLVVQVNCALLMAANLFLVRHLGGLLIPGRPVFVLMAVLFTALYYPLNRWALSGMEVALLCPLATGAACAMTTMVQRGGFTVLPYVLLGIGILVRLDVAVLYLAVWGMLLLMDAPSRKRHLIVGGVLGGAVVLGQTLFRLAYYGDILPNTYYLKMSGFPASARMLRGFSVFTDFLSDFNWLLFLLPLLFSVATKSNALRALAALVLTQCAYSVYIGGDAWEDTGGSNRFVSTVMPLQFVLLSVMLAAAWKRFVLSPEEPRMPLRLLLGRVTASVLLVLALIDINWTTSPRSFQQALLQGAPDGLRDQMHLAEMAHRLRSSTSEQAKIAVVWAGTLPYFLEREYVDMLGKNDRKIAHMPMRFDPAKPLWKQFYPGHLKWDNADLLQRHNPDVIAQQWYLAEPIQDNRFMPVVVDGEPVLFRKDSPHVDLSGLLKPSSAPAGTPQGSGR